MKLNLFLSVLFVVIGAQLLQAQNSEEEKLFIEAIESRFNDPYKSLKLYDYLLKNTTTEESVAIEIKKLQIYRLLSNYEEAVAISQKIESTITNSSRTDLQFEYWRELATLYEDLDLKGEGNSVYEKALKSYNNLDSNLKKNYAVDLALLKVKYLEDQQIEDKISGLKKILDKMDGNDERKPFIQFQIAKLYYPQQNDSSSLYFNKVIQDFNVKPLSQASRTYLNLIHTDSVENPKVVVNLFDVELEPVLLNEAIKYWSNKGNEDSLLFYEKRLQNHFFKTQQSTRKAKVALIEGLYRKKQTEAAYKITVRNRQLYVFIGLLCLLLLIYFGNKYYTRIRADKSFDIDNSKGTVISDKTEEEILEKLRKFENSKLYLDKQLRIASLAKQLGTNTRYLSSIINASKNKSFNAYINSLRIQFIVDKLNSDAKYRSYKISYLAEESGFVSQSSFTTAFKEITGSTPSAYIKNISD